MANIEEHFEFSYACEEAKKEFQVTINNLLELDGILTSKAAEATLKNKEGVFLTNGEMEFITNLLLDSCRDLLLHYTALDRTNRITNKLYRAGQKIREHQKVIPFNDAIHVNR